ncbi:hypothetical protein FZEAL_1335 [Fusarium zealandicum]|uniref:Uncharacterized protein n=1 Tax=Fusarium zealandicum TaxID=1053134 RepID=A0A8H4XNS9_9HYPO|nr:hypothetical protein FZEAL_1335 [Fusarium zealandicum]
MLSKNTKPSTTVSYILNPSAGRYTRSDITELHEGRHYGGVGIGMAPITVAAVLSTKLTLQCFHGDLKLRVSATWAPGHWFQTWTMRLRNDSYRRLAWRPWISQPEAAIKCQRAPPFCAVHRSLSWKKSLSVFPGQTRLIEPPVSA